MPTDATRIPGGHPGAASRHLQLLRTSAEPRSIASMADELGVHPNTIRFHLDALLRAGRVEQVLGDTAGPGRPPMLFRASRRMDPTGPTNYRLLASILTSHLAEHPRCGGVPPKSGSLVGPVADPTSTTPRAVQDPRGHRTGGAAGGLGFRARTRRRSRARDPVAALPVPEPGRTTRRGDLLAAPGPDAGRAERDAGPVTVDRLDPFVEPDLCVAHLASAPTRDRESS